MVLKFRPWRNNGKASGTSVHRIGVRDERTNLINQLRRVDSALSVLGKVNGGSTAPKHHVSAAARRKMSLAQKARWAKATAKPVRRMSAAARKKIAAAQRARWAKVKAKKAA